MAESNDSDGVDELGDSFSVGTLVDEQQQEKRDDKQLQKDLTAFFNAVDRVVTMMRVYPFGHPLLDSLIDQLMSRLEPNFERVGDIHFNIDADELTSLTGVQVFSEEMAEKEGFIWYSAYSDGVLQVEFMPEMTPRDLAGFIRVIERSASGHIRSDDDTVTLLWEEQFDGINYFAVEGFVDAGTLEEFGERTEKDAIEMIVDAAIDPGGAEAKELGGLFGHHSLAHLDLFTKMQIEANAKIVVPELRDEDLAYAFAVDPKLVEKLADEWGEGADLEYRLIEALLSIIRVSPGSPGAERAAELITSVTRQLLESEMFEQAVRILELLHDRREMFFDADYDPLGELVEQLSDPMQVEALVNLFQREVKQREAMMRLFRLLGREVVLKQILRLLADDDRNVVALSQLVDIVFELVDEDTEHLVTHEEFIESPVYLDRLMSELPDRDYVEWGPTRRLIRKAIDDPSPKVRERAIALKHPCWDEPGLAQNYLVPMADDPDERIRKLALELLADKHPRIFEDAIRDTLLARKMGDRTHAELRFLMRAFLDSSDHAAEELRSMLDVKGWFGTDAVEFAKMAAAILVEANDQKALEKIEAQQNSFWVSKALKRAYDDILERFGGGGTAPPPKPSADGEDAPPPASSQPKLHLSQAKEEEDRVNVIEVPDEYDLDTEKDSILTGDLPEGYE